MKNSVLDSVKPFFMFAWKPYEIVWLCLFSSIALYQALFLNVGWFAFSVFLSGIFCVILAAKGHITNYVIGLYNCFGYAWIAQCNGLYGEVGLNLFFFAPMSLVGLFLWRNKLTGARVLMRTMAVFPRILLLFGVLAVTAPLGYLLDSISGQNTPYIDASTNVLSVAATFLMALRYREQWMLYIALNVLSVVMWCCRYMSGSSDGMIMLALWSAYLVNSIYGWWNWGRGAENDRQGAIQGPPKERTCPKPV